MSEPVEVRAIAVGGMPFLARVAESLNAELTIILNAAESPDVTAAAKRCAALVLELNQSICNSGYRPR